MIINGQVIGTERVTADLRAEEGRTRSRVRQTVNRLGVKLQTHVKKDKLTGQVLRVKSGRLRRSINLEMSETEDSITASVGTNVNYGIGWEMGHRRPAVDIYPKNKLALFWPGAAHPVKHVHQPARDVRARPFLVPALNDLRAEIRERLGMAAAGEL